MGIKKKNAVKISLRLIIALLGFGGLWLLDQWMSSQWSFNRQKELKLTGQLFKNRLEQTVLFRSVALESLVTLFSLNPNTTPEEFSYFSSLLIKNNPPIRALRYADADTQVIYEYSSRGNEITIENPMVLLSDPVLGPYVKKTIDQKRTTLQGPLRLRPEETGVVLRKPVFKSGEFVGLVIGEYNVNDLLNEGLKGLDRQKIEMTLADENGEIIIGKFDKNKPYESQTVKIADTEWILSLAWKERGYPGMVRALIWGSGFGLLFSFFLLVRASYGHTLRLEKKVKARTRDLVAANKRLVDQITARKKSETILQKSEARFKRIIEKSPLPMVLTDAHQKIIYFNEKFTETFGYTLDDVRKTEDWWEIAYPDAPYRQRVRQSWKNEIDLAQQTNSEIEMQEWELTTRERVKRTCEFYMVPLGDVGVIIVKDITERKKAEMDLWKTKDRFQKVFHSQLDAIFILNADKKPRIVECNSASESMFGYTCDEMIDSTIDKLHINALHHKEFQAILYREIRKHGFLKDIKFSMAHKDGTLIPTEHVVLEIKDDSDKRTGWISIVRDLTERRRFELRLQQAQKMEAIGTLAGGIAHDFNNILFPMLGFAEILKEDIPRESPLHNHISEILKAALRARELVRQILTFSRQAEHEVRPLRLQPILKEVVKLLGASIPKTIDIQTQINPDCGFVSADPTQIHQIIMNLATNAYHAMQVSGGQLTIKLNQMEMASKPLGVDVLSPGTYALLQVIDSGEGIKKQDLDKVFDPYFTTKSKDKGTGLGLSVVQGIVKTFHGDIQIYSEPGRGTQVNVYLPVLKTVSDTKKTEPERPIPGGNERLLLVDDEEAIVRMEKEMLERLGYQVVSRTQSVEALAVFKADPDAFDLILTDMTMPKMTGIGLAEQIKQINPDTPIILCTGFSDQIDQASCNRMGIQAYVIKPVVTRVMAETIRSVLDGGTPAIEENTPDLL